MTNPLAYYLDAYKGFRREVWILTLVSLVNRAGTMVIPFLSLYLTGEEGFSLRDVGWVMSAFGLGSLCGSWLGGKWSDRFGYYSVMLWSMLIPGLMFIALQFVHSFFGFCVGIFLIMTVADMFRPAMFVGLRAYSKVENRTRSVSLVRLAINLGYSVGPAIGGLIIAKAGYNSLFWIDGVTCLIAGSIIFLFLPKQPIKTAVQRAEEAKLNSRSPYRDQTYVLFLVGVFLTGFVFLQCFSTLPLYYRDVHALSEHSIGLLLALNGFLVFLVEMPLIKWSEERRWRLSTILLPSALMIGMAYAILNVWHSTAVLVIGILLLTFGEIFNFPIANRMAMDRSEGGKVGDYMGLYTIAFAIAHILGHNGGLILIDTFGYTLTWWVMGAVMLFASAIVFVTGRKMEETNRATE